MTSRTAPGSAAISTVDCVRSAMEGRLPVGPRGPRVVVSPLSPPRRSGSPCTRSPCRSSCPRRPREASPTSRPATRPSTPGAVAFSVRSGARLDRRHGRDLRRRRRRARQGPHRGRHRPGRRRRHHEPHPLRVDGRRLRAVVGRCRAGADLRDVLARPGRVDPRRLGRRRRHRRDRGPPRGRRAGPRRPRGPAPRVGHRPGRHRQPEPATATTSTTPSSRPVAPTSTATASPRSSTPRARPVGPRASS